MAVALWPSFAAAAFMTGSVLWLKAIFVSCGNPTFALVACIVTGAVVYTAAVGLLSWRQIISDLRALQTARGTGSVAG